MPPVVLPADGKQNTYINDEHFHLDSGDESSKKEITEEKNDGNAGECHPIIVPEIIAKEALIKASAKLPIKTKFIKRVL